MMLGKPSLAASARVLALACLFALIGLWLLGCMYPDDTLKPSPSDQQRPYKPQTEYDMDWRKNQEKDKPYYQFEWPL